MEAIHKRVLTLLIAFTTLFVSAQGFTIKNPAYVASLPRAAAGGGVDGWQDIIDETQDDSGSSFGTDAIAHDITVTGTGNITKLRIRINNSSGLTENIKLALYKQDGTEVYGSGTVAVLSTDDDVWAEVTLDTPRANTGTVTYQLAAISDGGGGVGYYWKGGVGALDICTSQDYATFPPTPICSPLFTDLTRKIVASAYLDVP